jgi:hypothetical protein
MAGWQIYIGKFEQNCLLFLLISGNAEAEEDEP